jgi:hypothetical protein
MPAARRGRGEEEGKGSPGPIDHALVPDDDDPAPRAAIVMADDEVKNGGAGGLRALATEIVQGQAREVRGQTCPDPAADTPFPTPWSLGRNG